MIGGSRALPKGQAPRLLALFLAGVPDDTLVLLRHPVTGRPGDFETGVAHLAGSMHLGVEWCKPEPTDETKGRAATYTRDYAMVERADLVLLYVSTKDLAGESGTTHLADAALQADRPLYVYSLDPEGKVERVGEYDEGHLFDAIVPSA